MPDESMGDGISLRLDFGFHVRVKRALGRDFQQIQGGQQIGVWVWVKRALGRDLQQIRGGQQIGFYVWVKRAFGRDFQQIRFRIQISFYNNNLLASLKLLETSFSSAFSHEV